MTISESDLVNSINSAPINYTLLKLIHHELGNGLAVLTGYRHLLQRAISTQGQELFSPTQDAQHSRQECWLGYLQAMHDREMRLNHLLSLLRIISSGTTDVPLCQNFVRTDLVALLGQVIEQRVSFCPDCVLNVSLPAQSLFIMCDPFWIQVLLEHVLFNYIIVRQANIVPAEIHLEPFPNSMGQEAKITLRLRSDLPGRPSGKEGEFEAHVRRLELGESEACCALVHEILHEHGGRIWSEQERSFSFALPLVEEREERL